MTGAWILQSSLVALAILTAVRALRGRAAALREALLLVALIKFVVPPALLPFGFLFNAAASAPAPLAAPLPSAFYLLPSFASASASAPAAVSGTDPLVWLLVVYAGGVLAVFTAVLSGQLRLLRVLRTATQAESALQARVVSLAASLGCRAAITVQRCDAIAAPIAVGVFRRRIVVPGRLLASLEPSEIDAVLLHEIAHHRKGHIASGWVRAAVCAAWWWNPLAWMVARALRHTQEEVCDDLVIERAGMAPERYCDVLVHAASVSSTPAGAAAFAQALHPLGRRVKRLLHETPAPASAWQVWTVAAAVACAVLPGAASRIERDAPTRKAQAAGVGPAVSSPFDAAGAIAPAVSPGVRRVRPPAPAPPPIPVAETLPLPSLMAAGISETLVEVPATVRETGAEAAESVRDIIYDAMRDAGAPAATASSVSDDASRQIKIRIRNREVVRSVNRGILRALNPVNWFKSGSGSASPSPSPSPTPSPSPSSSPSKDRR